MRNKLVGFESLVSDVSLEISGEGERVSREIRANVAAASASGDAGPYTLLTVECVCVRVCVREGMGEGRLCL